MASHLLACMLSGLMSITRPLCLVLGVGLALSCAATETKPEKEKSSQARLQLSIDMSPVGEGVRPGLVTGYADVLEPVQKAIVSVYSTKIVRSRSQVPQGLRPYFGDAPEAERRQDGLGSGVILSADGYLVTNNHVVEGADELKVLLSDDREFVGKLVGTDSKTDLAVLKIEAEKLPYVTLADSDKLRVGDLCFALGNPLGVGQTVTMGIVSAVGRSNLELLEDGSGYESFIQTDAAINMGNSGGALLDARGRLIGINTAILSPSKGSIGIGFSIPSNLVSSVLRGLVDNNGIVQRGMLGVSGDSLNKYPELAETLGLGRDQKGVLVQQLRPEDGPAAKAGLQREDVIVAVNDRPVNTLQDLRYQISQMSPGTVARVRFIRGGKERSVEVTLGSLETPEAGRELFPGVEVAPVSEELRSRFEIGRGVAGLVVERVEDGSPFRTRLAPGIVIIEVNRTPVSTLQQAKDALKKGVNNLLYVYYRGTYRYMAIPSK